MDHQHYSPFSATAATFFSNLRWPETIISLLAFTFLHFYITQRSAPLKTYPLLRNLPDLLVNIPHLHDWITSILARTGGVVKVSGPFGTGMEIVATCDPRNIEHILKTNFDNYPKGTQFQSIFTDLMGSGIFNADSDSWKTQRKFANAHVHSKSFREFMAETTRSIVQNQLLPLLRNKAKSRGAFDLHDVMLRFTFDSTCTSVFGENPRCLSDDFPTVPFAKAIEEVMEGIVFRYVLPESWWRLLRRFNLGKERQIRNALIVIDEFVYSQIKKKKDRSDRSNDQNDLLKIYMSIFSDDQSHDQYPIEIEGDADKFLRDTAVNFLVAGRDTSGTALSWFFWNLSQNPEIELKILEEQKRVLSESNRKSIEIEDLKKMVYLHASLCETLRLFPSVPIGQKGVLREEILPSGIRVRPGTLLLYFIYSVGRMEWIWGKDCMEFRPERWMDVEGRSLLKQETSNNYRFVAFNGGPRTCVGKDMAFVQMKYAAAQVLRNFHVKVLEEEEEVKPQTSVILLMKKGMKVVVRERDRV